MLDKDLKGGGAGSSGDSGLALNRPILDPYPSHKDPPLIFPLYFQVTPHSLKDLLCEPSGFEVPSSRPKEVENLEDPHSRTLPLRI